MSSTEWFFVVDCIKAAGIWAVAALAFTLIVVIIREQR